MGSKTGTVGVIADIAGVVVGLASVVIATVALTTSAKTAKQQLEMAKAVEERQTAPALQPGVEPERVSARVRVSVEGRILRKPADRLRFVNSGRSIIVPVWNIGAGPAVFRKVSLLDSCADVSAEPALRPRQLGYHNVPAGKSQQIVWPLRPSDRPRRDRLKLHVLLRYTDLNATMERWTCVDYTRPRKHDRLTVATLRTDQRSLKTANQG